MPDILDEILAATERVHHLTPLPAHHSHHHHHHHAPPPAPPPHLADTPLHDHATTTSSTTAAAAAAAAAQPLHSAAKPEPPVAPLPTASIFPSLPYIPPLFAPSPRNVQDIPSPFPPPSPPLCPPPLPPHVQALSVIATETSVPGADHAPSPSPPPPPPPPPALPQSLPQSTGLPAAPQYQHTQHDVHHHHHQPTHAHQQSLKQQTQQHHHHQLQQHQLQQQFRQQPPPQSHALDLHHCQTQQQSHVQQFAHAHAQAQPPLPQRPSHDAPTQLRLLAHHAPPERPSSPPAKRRKLILGDNNTAESSSRGLETGCTPTRAASPATTEGADDALAKAEPTGHTTTGMCASARDDAKSSVMPPSAKSILERRERAIREGRRKDAKLSDAERRILRRLRNRESAERCRLRRMEQAAQLEHRMCAMQVENERLQAVASRYEQTILHLKRVIVRFAPDQRRAAVQAAAAVGHGAGLSDVLTGRGVAEVDAGELDGGIVASAGLGTGATAQVSESGQPAVA